MLRILKEACPDLQPAQQHSGRDPARRPLGTAPLGMTIVGLASLEECELLRGAEGCDSSQCCIPALSLPASL